MTAWLKHAFAVEPPGPAKPTEAQEAVVEKTTRQNSAELGRNMAREGRSVGDGEAAAHIVASTGKMRQWAISVQSRAMLARFGITVNDAANGIPIGHPRFGHLVAHEDPCSPFHLPRSGGSSGTGGRRCPVRT